MKRTITTTTTWTTPDGYVWPLAEDILEQTHTIIGGTTGAGKSVLLHDIIFTALARSPLRCQFVFIDLKHGQELYQYSKLPHVIAYAEEPEQAIEALNKALDIMDERNKTMRAEGKKTWSGSQVYIIADEVADLMQTAKRPCLDQLTRLMRLGRSAGIHCILATQNPARTSGGGIPAPIAQNLTAGVCLRVRTATESRQVISVPGGEKLPKHGRGLYWNADGITEKTIPITPEDDLNERINYWETAVPEITVTKEPRRKWKWFWN